MGHTCCGDNTTKGIKTAFFLNLGFAIIEIIGGVLTNSISILSDALHDFGDSMALGLSWYLESKSKEGPTAEYSYGKRRLSLLSGLINGVILFLGSLFIIKEAVERLLSPEHVNAQGMLLLAILGIVVNGYAVYRLQGGSGMNTRSVRLHLIEDVIGWVAVLLVSIILLFYDIPQLDTLLGIAIALYVIFHAFKILKSALCLFLQKVPDGIDAEEITRQLNKVKGVEEIHHVHVRSLDGDKHVFTAHVKVNKCNENDIVMVKQMISEVLEAYSFEHTTIEIEFSDKDCSQK